MQIMKKISKTEDIVEKLICNKCGREIQLLHSRAAEGVCSVRHTWQYGSDKDGETHKIDLCETCYDEWAAEFQIPVTVEERCKLDAL